MAKLNLSGIQEGLFRHVEKICVGIAGLIFCYMLFGIFGLSGVSSDKQPQELVNLAQQKQTALESSQMPKTEIPPDTNFTQRAQPRKIDLASYSVHNVWKPTFREPFQKREQPKLLPIADLRVASGTGSFVFSGAPPDADERMPVPTRGAPGPRARLSRERDHEGEGAPMRRMAARGPGEIITHGVTSAQPGNQFKVLNYTVVTGLIPYRQQFEIYHSSFAKAQGQMINDPAYGKTELQRAEVPAGKSTLAAEDLEKLAWADIKIDDDTYTKYFSDWVRPGQQQEVVNPKYLLEEADPERPVFASALGPLWRREWGPEAAHAPEIRYLPPGSSPDAEEDEEGAAAEAPRQVTPIRAPVPRGRDFDHPGDGRRSPIATGRGAAGPVSDVESLPKYKLFRFVDFTAEPGKTYVYRARLVLDNPNFDVDMRYLKSEDLRKEEMVFTPWCDPTPPIAVKDAAASLLVDGLKEHKYTVRKITRTYTFPWLRLLGFDPKSGLPLSTIMPAARGAVLNTRTDVDAADPTTQEIKTYKNIDFITNMAVVDMYGGRTTTSKDKEKFTEPIEVVLADAKGRLHYRHELDDAELNKEFAEPEEEPSEPVRPVVDDHSGRPVKGPGGKGGTTPPPPRRDRGE